LAVDVVGRREELLGIDGFLGAIPAGGQALLLEGDAGIGKTVLSGRRPKGSRVTANSAS
jgi:archaellum biogenesis ATPase FlaH